MFEENFFGFMSNAKQDLTTNAVFGIILMFSTNA